MINKNVDNRIKWGDIFKYSLPFLPIFLYLLTSLDILPAEIMPVVLVISVAVLVVWGGWNIWSGISHKEGGVLGRGVELMAFAVLIYLLERGILSSNLSFYLGLLSVGVSWLIEKLFLKVWEQKGFV